MKKTILAFGLGIVLTSCGGGSTSGAIDTVDNAAQTYCDAATKADAAAEADKEKLNQELNDLENKIEKEHEGDEAWFNEFEQKVEEICQKG
ncbi:MAG: hypothetical protein HYZ14_14990 [Bacteroidetes bacterium]|nr:hypothetical protein [Bacteroidota bacterium]